MAHLILLELSNDVVEQHVVKALASKESVSIGGLDLKHAARHLQDRDIKGAASQIIHLERSACDWLQPE